MQSSDIVGTTYTPAFFEKAKDEALSSAQILVPMILNLVPANSVVDVGCALGAWLSVFQEFGVKTILGLDGPWVSKEQLLIPETSFMAVDLTKPFHLADRFDMALCLEVAEHIPRRSSHGLVQSLCNLAPVVVFSAAIPGQEGTLHINEQWPDFWASLFAKEGFVRLDPFRRQIWMNPKVAWYYQQNLFMFVRKDIVASSPRLSYEWELVRSCQLTLVHPKVLRPMRSVRHALRTLPSLVREALRRRIYG